MKRLLKELKRRLFEEHYRILEVECFEPGINLYYPQKLSLLGWSNISIVQCNIGDARKVIARYKHRSVVKARVIEEC